ncbi:pilus assembly PilX family protein [Halomonas sp. LS-001]
MNAQRGVALVIVMVMLASAVMIGLSAMHATLLDDKQAASYRAMALVQMASEDAAVELLASPVHNAINDCSANNNWRAVTSLSAVHPAIQLECRQCDGSGVARSCSSPGETFSAVEDGALIAGTVDTVILLRSQLVDPAREKVVASRTLVITTLTDNESATPILRWHSL